MFGIANMVDSILKYQENKVEEEKDYSAINISYGLYSDLPEDAFVEYIDFKNNCTGISANKFGEFIYTATLEKLPLHKYKDGSIKVWVDSKYQFIAARIIAELFIKVPDELINNLPIIGYKNNNKSDIKYSNLIWKSKNTGLSRTRCKILITRDDDDYNQIFINLKDCSEATGINKSILYKKFSNVPGGLSKKIILTDGFIGEKL